MLAWLDGQFRRLAGWQRHGSAIDRQAGADPIAQRPTEYEHCFWFPIRRDRFSFASVDIDGRVDLERRALRHQMMRAGRTMMLPRSACGNIKWNIVDEHFDANPF